MLSRKIVLPFLFLCLLSGCAKRRPATAPDYYASSEYQNRDVLSQSLFKSDQAILSNDEIEKILGSKIQLPRQAHLTVLRLGSSQEILSWAFLSGSENPLSVLDSSPRLTRVSWLPSLLVPEKLTVSLLREAAARFQADLLLVYRSPCQRFQDYRLFGTDKAKTYCVAEGILLDVRTGVIPFSTATTREVRVEEKSGDVSFYETMQKAEAQATAQALTELAQQLSEFLAAAP
ncbi:MAG: hypothetical protein QOH06_2516 [Acidobacteriota bacterium]|jgi:hypothetical protein|nr:hypothetical protein [Acidobacteriota bacterium]